MPLFPLPLRASVRLRGEAVARWSQEVGFVRPSPGGLSNPYQFGPLYLTNICCAGWVSDFEAEFVVRDTEEAPCPDTTDAGVVAAWVIEQAREHIPTVLIGADLSVEVQQPTR